MNQSMNQSMSRSGTSALAAMLCGTALALLAACDTSYPPGTGPGAGARGGQMPQDERRIVGSGNSAKGGVGGERGVGVPDGVWVVNRMPIALVRGETFGLEVAEDGSRNLIVRGDAEVDIARVADQGIDRIRRVEDVRTNPDVQMVVIDVSTSSKMSVLHPAAIGAGTEAAPVLVDEQGERYLAVGLVYTDSTKARVRFEPGTPVQAAKELPAISRSRTDQRLWLVFLVTTGKKVRYFGFGNKAVVEFNPTWAAEPYRGLD
jgi:hypothetical protein